MNTINLLSALLKNPIILLKARNIFLISHMRGNTSLLSHLMGSHPAIEGYYEMQIGYYSWKSLIRQKLLYLNDHQLKKNSRYFFDKVLHNEHEMVDDLLKRDSSKVIIMLREPEQTIKSIVSIYRKKTPNHEFCQIEAATEYYALRLAEIKKIADMLQGDYFFVQADKLKSEPEQILSQLSDWLGLDTPIPMNYDKFKKTGKEKYGDSSENIMTGSIQKKMTDYSDILIDPDILEPINKLYGELSNTLSASTVNSPPLSG